MSERSLSLLKGVVALGAALVLVVVMAPQMLNVLNRSVPDHGARPLVMVTTSGGDRDYEMRVRNFVDHDGDYRFVVSMIAEDVTYGPEGNAFSVNVQIALAVSTPNLGMSCGPGTGAVETVSASALGVGARHMLQTDAISLQNSALQIRPVEHDSEPTAVPSPSGAPRPTSADLDSLLAGLTVHRFDAELRLLDDQYDYTTGVEENGILWAIECKLDNELVWRASDVAQPLQQAEASLFPPEFDFGPQGATSDYQRGMTVTLSVARAAGIELFRAYPEPLVRSSDWFVKFEHHWIGNLTEEGNFGYASGPTLLTANREAAAGERNLLLWGGVLLGLALTLLVRGLSDLSDATLVHKGGKRSDDVKPPSADRADDWQSTSRHARAQAIRRGRSRPRAIPRALARRSRRDQ